MAVVKKIKEKINSKNKKTRFIKYDETYEIEKIKLGFLIINHHQAEFFIKNFDNIGIPCTFLTYGYGTASKEIYDALGVGDIKKDILLVVFKESLTENIKDIINKRFSISKGAKGIFFSIYLDSVSGVLTYKYLTDTRENRSKKNEQ